MRSLHRDRITNIFSKTSLLLQHAALLCLVVSCTQADIDEPEKPITPVVPVIDIPISEITIPDAGAGSATFTTNNSWTIQTSDTKAVVSWFDVTPKSGDAGSNTLTITIKESNPNYEDRSAYIHIKSGELTKTITVSQKKKEAILVSKDRYEIEPLGGSFAVEVKSNVTYQVVIPDESTAWISHISSKSLSTSTENFSVAAGSLDGKREGMVIFVSGELKDTVHVYQSQLDCIILTDKTININEKTQNFPVELKTNIDYDISFIGGDWLHQIQTKAIRVDRQTFMANENTSHDFRTMQVVFKDRASSLSDTLTVRQAQKNALILSQKDLNFSNEGGIASIELRSNIQYDIIIPTEATWITKIESKALITDHHQFKIATYSGTENRSAQIIFKDKSSQLSDTLTVRQAQKNALILSQKDLNFSNEGGIASIELRSNIQYDIIIPTEATWITKIESKALVTDHHQFKIAAYSGTENRSAQVIFKDKSSQLSDTLTVRQTQKNALILSQKDLNFSNEGGIASIELRSNIQYDIIIPTEATWITKIESKALITDHHQFKIAAYSGTENRSAQIIFKDKSSQLSDTLTVRQTQKNALILSQKNLHFNNKGGIASIELRSNIQYDIIIPTAATWITKIDSKALVTDHHQFKIAAYSGTGNRSAQVIFKDKSSQLSDILTITQDNIIDERAILTEFYIATGGINWKTNTNWVSDKPLNQWFGIKTNNENKIISINLNNNNLVGKVPVSVFELTFLEDLILNSNSSVEVDISAKIAQCKNLKRLILSNVLYGNISDEIYNLTNLIELNLGRANGLLSQLPIPEKFANLTSLKSLTLNNFDFRNTFPNSILQLMQLSNLAISSDMPAYKDIACDIPEQVFDMTNLERLSISGHKLKLTPNVVNLRKLSSLVINLPYGELPNEIFTLTNLERLILGSGTYSSDVKGTIPKEIANLQKIGVLNFVKMNLTGTLPSEIGSLPLLKDFACYGNKLTGVIPNDITSHHEWKNWNSSVNIYPQQNGYGFDMGIYVSTDYSQDGKITLLQKSTKGKGVNILLVGDGFVDRDMDSGGKYEKAMNDAMGHFFDIEPTKSYKEYFNVYSVKVVSKNEVYGNPAASTAFSVMFEKGTTISGDDRKCLEYANKVLGTNAKDIVVCVIVNSPKYAGSSYTYSDGFSCTYIPLNDNGARFAGVFHHEVIGHGFCKLLDEYTYNNGYITTEYFNSFNTYRNTYDMGWNMTLNRDDVPWKHFIGDARYPMVGLFEGGYFYKHGVWRAEKNQCMNNNIPYFNGPSRELFVKRLKKLAGETYSWDEFVANDKYEPYIATKALDPTYNQQPLAPPVFIKGSPRKK